MAAEYIPQRGEPPTSCSASAGSAPSSSTRNTLDLSAVPVLKRATHLPVIVDPSHERGGDLVLPLARAASRPAPTA